MIDDVKRVLLLRFIPTKSRLLANIVQVEMRDKREPGGFDRNKRRVKLCSGGPLWRERKRKARGTGSGCSPAELPTNKTRGNIKLVPAFDFFRRLLQPRFHQTDLS